jgi:hypothetical protein
MTPQQIRTANETLELRERVADFIEVLDVGTVCLTQRSVDGEVSLSLDSTQATHMLMRYRDVLDQALQILGVKEAA